MPSASISPRPRHRRTACSPQLSPRSRQPCRVMSADTTPPLHSPFASQSDRAYAGQGPSIRPIVLRSRGRRPRGAFAPSRGKCRHALPSRCPRAAPAPGDTGSPPRPGARPAALREAPRCCGGRVPTAAHGHLAPSGCQREPAPRSSASHLPSPRPAGRGWAGRRTLTLGLGRGRRLQLGGSVARRRSRWGVRR